MKKWFLLILLVIMTFSTGCSRSALSKIEKEIGAKFPDNSQVLYYAKGSTFTGEASVIALISVKSEPTKILYSGLNFRSNRDVYIEELLESRLASLDFPEEDYPNWKDEHIWVSTSEGYYGMALFYFPDTMRVFYCNWGH